MDESLLGALRLLNSQLADQPSLTEELRSLWSGGTGIGATGEVAEAAQLANVELPLLPAHVDDTDLRRLLEEQTADAVLLWCAAAAHREDAVLAPLVRAAAGTDPYAAAAVDLARARIVEGPLRDSLACVPLLGTGQALKEPENLEAGARFEILVWEAGAAVVEVPFFARWVWADRETFDAVVARPARGSLRGRVLAASCLELSASFAPATDPEAIGRALQILQPLLLHPEPMVWIHAARAFGRLAGTFEPLEGTLLDWVHGATPVLRQRAVTAFASLPKQRLAFLSHELQSILDAPDQDGWVLAAAAAATPYLFHERRDIWQRLAQRILHGDGGAVSARALARGLASLWRRGSGREDLEAPLRRLRQLARRAKPEAVDETRRWLEIIAVTDVLDGAERDPLDLELGLENLVRLAAQYDDEEADARAARFATTLGPSFLEARRMVVGEGTTRQRASGINALEGCARSLALRLWRPMLHTRPRGTPIAEPDLQETWETLVEAPSALLELVKEWRGEDQDPAFALALELLALKLGGYALDACGEESVLRPGPTAHDTCLWLRKLDGLADGSRELPPSLQGALSAIFWRLVDTTRGTALGEVDDVEWLGPFAAWWALVIDRPQILQQLATALPMIADGALETCCELADRVRDGFSTASDDGAWGPSTLDALDALKAGQTELAASLAGFAEALSGFRAVAGPRPGLEPASVALVLAGERLRSALEDPVRALREVSEANDDSLAQATTVNAPRMATVVGRAIRTRDLNLLDVWFASLGPTAATLAERAVTAAIKRTPPPPPPPKRREPKVIQGYELVRPLGEGGVGSVWLVRKPGADRFFVLKIPKAEALQNATDTEREGILASFVEEARALAGLYHPNVANIIDRGVEGNVPFLVLEYLIGADLKQYAGARLMSLFELRRVVLETCAGLTALHNAGLVHRDIKPANL
ncbi:MAG: protein kinase, partial [Myxococcota bacterium]